MKFLNFLSIKVTLSYIGINLQGSISKFVIPTGQDEHAFELTKTDTSMQMLLFFDSHDKTCSYCKKKTC